MPPINTGDYPDYTPLSLTAPPTPSVITSGYSSQYNSGIFEVAYSLVDRDNKITPKSPVTTLTMPYPNWGLLVDAPTNNSGEEVATMFWIRRLSGYVAYPQENEWRPLGSQGGKATASDTVYPYLSIGCYTNNWYRGHLIERAVYPYVNQQWYNFNDSFWATGSYLSTPSVAPTIRTFHCPNYNYELKYSYVGESGETLGSSIVIPAVGNIENQSGVFIKVNKNQVNLVNGIMGCHLYMRQSGTSTWHRQKPSRIHEETNGDEYLWPVSQNTFDIHEFSTTNITPLSASGQSNLTSLQWAMQFSTDNVIINSNQVLTCPVISPLNNPYGTCRSRTIGTANNGNWTLTTQSNFPKTAPMWVENAIKTRLVGCSMTSDRAEAGIHFIDSNNGGAFHFRSDRVNIALTKPGYTVGIAQYWEGISLNDSHSCSEPIFNDTEIGAKFPIVVEGNQSLNWIFNNLTASSDSSYESCVAHIDNYGTVLFTGRLTCDAFHTIFSCVNAARVTVDNVFTDAGIANYFTVCGVMPTFIKGMFSNINHRYPQLLLLNCPNQGRARVELDLEIRQANNQTNPQVPINTVLFTPRYNGIISAGKFVSGFLWDMQRYQPDLTSWQSKTYFDNGLMATVSYYNIWDNSVPVTQSYFKYIRKA